MTYLCTKFYTAISSDSLIVAIKPIGKRMFAPPPSPMFIFYKKLP